MVHDHDGAMQPTPLAAFVRNLPEIDPRPSAHPDLAVLVADRKRNAALDNIERDIRRDRPINVEDVTNLKPADLAGIRKSGDDHMRAIVQERQQERKRDPDRGREREP